MDNHKLVETDQYQPAGHYIRFWKWLDFHKSAKTDQRQPANI